MFPSRQVFRVAAIHEKNFSPDRSFVIGNICGNNRANIWPEAAKILLTYSQNICIFKVAYAEILEG